MIYKIVIDSYNPETKVGMQSLQDKIIGTKSETFRHNKPDMLEHIKSVCSLGRVLIIVKSIYFSFCLVQIKF